DPVLQGTLALEIRNISTFMKDSGQSVTSPRQQVAGLRWLLEAYPQVVDDVTCLSCYLKCEQNAFKWSASLYGTFRIVTKNGGFGKEKNFPKWRLVGKEPLGDSWGWSKFITSNELQNPDSGFVVDDSVKILADFSVTDVCGVACNVFETVDALAADVKLKVGDRVFYANKGYLSVVSSVFRDMFALTKAAEDNTEMEEVELSDLNANEFMEFLGVVYPTRYSIT
ncbi:BTB/POZ domain-containing protein, partial [Aphelenchoides avenae]